MPDLAALGRGEGYVRRQVTGWVDRFGKARTDDTGDWSDVVAWIEEHQPDDVAQCLIHNDFRFDNMVLAVDEGPDGRALRIADHVGFMYLGELVEYGPADQVFGSPREQRTREYVGGAFG